MYAVTFDEKLRRMARSYYIGYPTLQFDYGQFITTTVITAFFSGLFMWLFVGARP